MILYNLKCPQNHIFEAWFKDSGAYDKQAKRKHIECPVCSDTAIEKAIMAPRLSSTTRKKGLEYETSKMKEHNRNNLKPNINSKSTSKAIREFAEISNKLQKHIEENCENVGKSFADEARAIHYGEAEERGIYGEASISEVKGLVDEDIPISSIPWRKNKPS